MCAALMNDSAVDVEVMGQGSSPWCGAALKQPRHTDKFKETCSVSWRRQHWRRVHTIEEEISIKMEKTRKEGQSGWNRCRDRREDKKEKKKWETIGLFGVIQTTRGKVEVLRRAGEETGGDELLRPSPSIPRSQGQ